MSGQWCTVRTAIAASTVRSANGRYFDRALQRGSGARRSLGDHHAGGLYGENPSVNGLIGAGARADVHDGLAIAECARDRAGEAGVRTPHRAVSTTHRVVGGPLSVGVHGVGRSGRCWQRADPRSSRGFDLRSGRDKSARFEDAASVPDHSLEGLDCPSAAAREVTVKRACPCVGAPWGEGPIWLQ